MVASYGWIHWQERTIPLLREVDVLVVGGGIAGAAAAVSAAREGARVVLVEKQGVLGGTATAGMMSLFYTPSYCLHGLLSEVVERLQGWEAAFPAEVIPYDAEWLKTLFFDMAKESGVDVLLHSTAVDTLVEDNVVTAVVVATPAGLRAIRSKVIVDCTGDAHISEFAGVFTVTGRESDHKMRPMTLLFRLGGVDVDKLLDYARKHPEDFSPDPNQYTLDVERKNIRVFGFFSLVKRAKEHGFLWDDCHYFRIENVMPDRGTLLVNSSRVYGLNGADPMELSRAEIEGRRQMRLLFEFARKWIPGCQASYILDSAAHIGIRETRRIVGEYVLTEDDIVQGQSFVDSIAVDCHRNNPGGEKGHSPDGGEGSETDEDVRVRIAPLVTYEIPYRSLVPKRIDNLLVAGRCISATHMADAFTRNQPAVMATGQAAGIAAALCARNNKSPRDMEVRELQKRLKESGVILEREEMVAWQRERQLKGEG
jgi:hypothetical protein